jgi:hypothetical protein
MSVIVIIPEKKSSRSNSKGNCVMVSLVEITDK